MQFFWKCFEKLLQFENKKHCGSRHYRQHGFREKFSTETALTVAANIIEHSARSEISRVPHMSIFPLFRLWLLCLSERRAEASLSSSPPTHFSMHIFYLCLCRLVCASLPILPSMLFSLLLVGKPLYGWACSPQLNWIVGTHKRSNTWQVFVQFLPGLDFDSFGQSTRLQDIVVALPDCEVSFESPWVLFHGSVKTYAECNWHSL